MEALEKSNTPQSQFHQINSSTAHPIENEMLKAKDEYTKSLYIRMLCTLIRYSGIGTAMQIKYIQRLLKGTNCEARIEDYMRKAMDINQTDIDSFISCYKRDLLRFTFYIDGIILLSLGEKRESKAAELLAGFMDLLEIKKEEAQYVSGTARSIVEQDDGIYDEARENWQESLNGLNPYFYLKDYYTGIIVENEADIHYYAVLKAEMAFDDGYISFKEKKVRFENLTIPVDRKWTFEDCDEVEFINCNLIQKEMNNASLDAAMDFNSVGIVRFSGCTIENFTVRMSRFQSVRTVVLRDNHFKDCGHTEEKRSGFGGIFKIRGNDCETLELMDNWFTKCYMASANPVYREFGVIAEASQGTADLKSVILKGNHFIECKSKIQGSQKISLFHGIVSKNVIEEENECKGGIRLIFS